MRIFGKIAIYFLLILLMLVLAILCYSAMEGVELIIEKINTLLSDNLFANIGVYALRFVVSGFKYAVALVLMYVVFRILWHYKSAYMALQIIVFVIFAVALVIVGPEFHAFIRFHFIEAYQNSMLVRYIKDFGAISSIDSYKTAVPLFTDLFLISLYYFGAIIKPIRWWWKYEL